MHRSFAYLLCRIHDKKKEMFTLKLFIDIERTLSVFRMDIKIIPNCEVRSPFLNLVCMSPKHCAQFIRPLFFLFKSPLLTS